MNNFQSFFFFSELSICGSVPVNTSADVQMKPAIYGYRKQKLNRLLTCFEKPGESKCFSVRLCVFALKEQGGALQKKY